MSTQITLDKRTARLDKKLYIVQTIFFVGISLLVWSIFNPGLFSNDSVNQYAQAVNGRFTNWHPPLMAIFLHIIFKIGGNVGTLTFVQCLMMILGLRSLSYQFLVLFYSSSKRKTILVTTLVPCVLLIPVTPLLFYTVTFWKDVWLEIFLMWITIYILWLNSLIEDNKQGIILHFIVIVFLSVFLPLIRHNAVVTLPIIGFCLSILLFKKHKQRGIKKVLSYLIIFVPLLASLLFQSAINRFFEVKDLHAEDGVKSLELSLLLKFYPELSESFPITQHHLGAPMVIFSSDNGTHFALWDSSTSGSQCLQAKNFIDPTSYSWENINLSSTTPPPPCYRFATESNQALAEEYWSAWRNHPVKLIKIKLSQFSIMLNPQLSLGYIFTKDIDDYPPLKTNEYFKKVRVYLYETFESVKSNQYLLYGLNIHVLWLVLNILYLLTGLTFFFRGKKSNIVIIIGVLLIPFSYYASYLLVTVATDYRFMHPSTLILQVLTLSVIVVIMKSFKTFISNI